MIRPIETTVNLLGNRWKVLILRNLLLCGTQRFTALANNIEGISQKMLVRQLRRLEADGLVFRVVYPQVPSRVEYTVTEVGESLKPMLEAMHVWGVTFLA